jgi:hypothetical protein
MHACIASHMQAVELLQAIYLEQPPRRAENNMARTVLALLQVLATVHTSLDMFIYSQPSVSITLTASGKGLCPSAHFAADFGVEPCSVAQHL